MATGYTQTDTRIRNSEVSIASRDIQNYFLAGEKFLESKKYAEAVAAFKHAGDLMHKDSHSLILFAKAYHGSGQWDEAIECLTKALKLKSNNVEAHHLLGLLRQEKMILDRSIAVHQKKVQENPKDPSSYYFLGLDYSQRGLTQEAIDSFTKAVELKPDFTDAYLQLGVIYARCGKVEWAISEYDKVLQIRPDNTEAAVQSVMLLIRKNDYEGTAKRLDEILQKHPSHPELNFYRGECYRHQGRWMEAISLYQTVIEQKPGFAEAWSKLAQGCRMLKQWEEARLAAQQAIQLDPHDANSYFILGLCSFQKNQAVNAQTYFWKYLQLAPDGLEANKAHHYLAELGKGVIPKPV